MKNIKRCSPYMYLAGIALSLVTAITIAQPEPILTSVPEAATANTTISPTLISNEQAHVILIKPSIATSDTSTNPSNAVSDPKKTDPAKKIKKEPLNKKIQKLITQYRDSIVNHLWGRGSFKQNYERRISTVSITTLLTTLIAAQYASNTLIKAALHGDNNTVKTFLEIPLPFDVNRVAYCAESNIRGLSALHAASKSGSATTVLLLLQHHANPNNVNYKSVTPLHEAAYRYDGSEMVTKLLQAKASINLRDQTGATALIYAALRNPVAVSILLENNANPSIADNGGNLPLHIAAREHQQETLNLLLTANPNVINHKTCLGNTPLHYASRNNNNKPEEQLLATLELLFRYGACPLETNRDNKLPRHLASNNNAQELLKERETFAKAQKWKSAEHSISNYVGTTVARFFTRLGKSYEKFEKED